MSELFYPTSDGVRFHPTSLDSRKPVQILSLDRGNLIFELSEECHWTAGIRYCVRKFPTPHRLFVQAIQVSHFSCFSTTSGGRLTCAHAMTCTCDGTHARMLCENDGCAGLSSHGDPRSNRECDHLLNKHLSKHCVPTRRPMSSTDDDVPLVGKGQRRRTTITSPTKLALQVGTQSLLRCDTHHDCTITALIHNFTG